MINSDAWGTLKRSKLLKKVQGYPILVFFLQCKTNVSPSESVIRLVSESCRFF